MLGTRNDDELEETPENLPISFSKLQADSAASELNRASAVVSPFEANDSFSSSHCATQSLSPLQWSTTTTAKSITTTTTTSTSTTTAAAVEEDAELAKFIDEHMQTKVLQRWFTAQAARFQATVFPQFFTPTLSAHYPELLTAAEAEAFWRTAAGFGDLSDSAIRDLTYSAQCQQLYGLLQEKVADRPSLIVQLIAALRHHDWYPALAREFSSELNSWRKQMLAQLNTAAPAPAPAPVPLQQLLGTAATTTMPGAAAGLWLPLATPTRPPTNLLINLPESPSFFTPRVEKAAELKRKLMSVSKDGNGWIILYGMGGSGKTTIAASTVREFYEQHPKKFTDGIFWLNIGKLNEKVNICSTVTTTTPSTTAASDNQQSQLLLKMEFLAELLRPFDSYQQFSTTKFDQIQTATFRLKQHFERNPKSLLILDDVWTTDVLESFNFNIPVLVTTREVSVVPRHFQNITPISIYAKKTQKGAESGEVLLMKEAIQLLYNCLTIPYENELVKLEHLKKNRFVRAIISNFKGLPFCIPLIANLMEHYYQHARNADFDSSSVMAMNNTSDPSSWPCFKQWKQLHAIIVTNNRGQLDSHLDTGELVRKSIESLDEPLKNRLYDFVIFAEAAPFCVFTTLWDDLEPFGREVEVMSILSKLVNKSLLIRIINSNLTTVVGGDVNPFPGRGGEGEGELGSADTSPTTSASFSSNSSFTLHSITLAFLKKELKPEEIKKRHSRLISRYLKRHCRKELSDRCEYDYCRLPDDQYIYHNLAYHLYSAQRWSLFAPIFLNLRFATRKILLVGPADLLHDLIDYGWLFEGADSQEKLSDYQAFIASHSNILCEPNVDTIQVALCMPNSSAVYQEAAALVKQIAAVASTLPVNSFPPHHPHYHHQHQHQRTFFDWCNKQNNCSKEEPRKLLSFKCLPEVNYAAYSPDGRMIVTVSGRSLEVWDSTTGQLIARPVDRHQVGTIHHVVFSRNGQYLLTSSEDGTAILWQCSQWTPPGASSLRRRHRRSTSLTEDIHHHSNNNNNNSHHLNSLSQLPSPLFTRHAIFRLNTTTKLKTDDPIADDPPAGVAPTFAHSVRCGDISSDNRYVLTGNGARSLHLWEVANSSEVKLRLILVDGDSEGTGDNENIDDEDVGKKEVVECCSFSGDSRFILGLVANVVYIFSVTEKIKLQTEVRVNKSTTGTYSTFSRNSPARSSTPPSRARRAGQVNVTLVHRLVHQFKVYNAIFHSSDSSYYPSVFTSSDKFIFEWDLNDNHSLPQVSSSSFLDSDDDFTSRRHSTTLGRLNLTKEKRKYSTTLSSQHSPSFSHSSGHHLSFVAISRLGNRIAGFEHTRNEIYLWSRSGDGTADLGFGRSRSPSPVTGGRCPSNAQIRCQPNIVSLVFSSDSERLLGCCRSGKITVWNVGKNVAKPSIVDLKSQFAVTFADKENKGDSVCVLTIDTKGFLRLFRGLEGDEDQQFLLDFQAHLSKFTEVANSDSSKKLMPVSPLPRLNIACCDIAPTGEVIFGTNAGEVFYYQTTDVKDSNNRLLQKMHGDTKSSPETVNHVHFRPGSSIHFISISDRCISFMDFHSPELSPPPSPSTVVNDSPGKTSFKAAIKKENIFLNVLLQNMNKEADEELFRLGDDQIKLDAFRFVAERSWLLFWSTTGHLWAFDYANQAIIYSTYLNNARITSVDLSSVNRRTGQQVMVVATSSKTIYTFRIRADNQEAEAEPIKEGPMLASKVLPRSILVAPDRTFIIVGDDGGGLARRIGHGEWQVTNAHTGSVHDLVISPDQRFLLSASVESVKLWSAFDGTLLQSFMTHGSVNRLVTRFAAAAGDDDDGGGGGGGGRRRGGPKVTVVTVTDASELYIFRTLN